VIGRSARRDPHKAPELRTAGFVRRAAAATVDWLLASVLVVALAHLVLERSVWLPPQTLPLLDHLADLCLHHGRSLLRLALLASGTLGAYWCVFHGLLGRTPGERLLGMRLLGPDGEPASAVRALLRVLLMLPCLAPLGLGFWWAAADRCRRTLYDRLSGTYLALS